MAELQGVILDVDGTLIDSNDAHAHAFQRAITEANIDVTFEEVRSRIGMGGDNLLPDVAQVSTESATGQRITQRRKEIFQAEYLPQLKPFPDVRALIERMLAQGLKLVVASSAAEEDLGHLLEAVGVADLLPQRVSSGDAEESKPAPDVFQVALQKLSLPADQVLVLGDSPYDVAAAQRAGLRMIGLRCGGFSDADLAGVLKLYDDPADLLAHYDASPLNST